MHPRIGAPRIASTAPQMTPMIARTRTMKLIAAGGLGMQVGCHQRFRRWGSRSENVYQTYVAIDAGRASTFQKQR